MVSRKKALRIVYVLAALVCISAVAIAGIKYREYHFAGKKDGAYVFTTEPEEVSTSNDEKTQVSNSVAILSTDPDFTIDVEQTKKDLEEIDLLRQQDKRELLKVIGNEVEGESHRVHLYKYVLADGREITMGEGDPDEERVSEKVLPKDLEEIDLLRQQDKRELLQVIETEVEGESLGIHLYRYVLVDGREMTIGEGNPDEERISEKVLSVDAREVWELRTAGKGELLDPEEREVKGKVFTFERHRLTLSDGREIIHSVGTPKEDAGEE